MADFFSALLQAQFANESAHVPAYLRSLNLPRGVWI